MPGPLCSSGAARLSRHGGSQRGMRMSAGRWRGGSRSSRRSLIAHDDDCEPRRGIEDVLFQMAQNSIERSRRFRVATWLWCVFRRAERSGCAVGLYRSPARTSAHALFKTSIARFSRNTTWRLMSDMFGIEAVKRAFSPRLSGAHEPGPLAQAGMTSGLCPC